MKESSHAHASPISAINRFLRRPYPSSPPSIGRPHPNRGEFFIPLLIGENPCPSLTFFIWGGVMGAVLYHGGCLKTPEFHRCQWQCSEGTRRRLAPSRGRRTLHVTSAQREFLRPKCFQSRNACSVHRSTLSMFRPCVSSLLYVPMCFCVTVGGDNFLENAF